MSGLRGLVEKATPGPWRHVPESDHFIVFASPNAAIHAAAYAETKDNARLIALAPDLALWAADAADALQNWKGQNHGFTRRGKPRRGCNLKTIHGCQPCRLLARFAVIEHTAQEDTP